MPVPSAIYAFAADLRAECDSDYQDYQEEYAARAEHETNGQVSRTPGVRTWDLITHNYVYAYAHATEEMRDFMDANPHLSAREFERRWLDGRHLYGGPQG